ncbi:lysine 5,6-aminomutase subunit alpha [Plantactinospora soyae]|uniref:Beta-lysine 5,6-aminomutase alpha subunit n=1 Tax=Plantactinospora soyae TaxID=1544732 RepID=A0A927MFV1_9ACTN|nr:lysine 5,6-aminomutase subunit alpha [Plantactinospora soyae]MBE1490375.1 beta-lysine 5,6-aminomutase alpha subunit [Plantactinospora soyae]
MVHGSGVRPGSAGVGSASAASGAGGGSTEAERGTGSGPGPVGKLALDPRLVRRARELARRAGQPVVELARGHTTVSVERAVLRLAGVGGADPDGIPWVNRLVDAVVAEVGLAHGVTLPVFDALVRELGPPVRGGRGNGVPATEVGEALTLLAQKSAAGSVRFGVPSGRAATSARAAARRAVGAGLRRIDRRRAERDRLVRRHGDPVQRPWIYLIVATGDIYEDIPQAQAAARAGADVIAVIRSTGQSLLDYVPEGATREGFAGTYATQENFRLMRAALDASSKELGRYVRLTNYASGLCMPEMAVLAGLERLDMMLNDSMYGILFRDINPVRTFVDQRFSRQVHARAGIIINTGEDNYLTTADAVDEAHTVTVSQLLNEFFAHEAGLADRQLGLGHAFEIDPAVPESFRLELAHALLARELFPDAPLKWMPPTRYMTGDVFRGNLLDGFFNLVGTMTRQDILLVGMMTEAVVTPWLSDRDIALQNVRYVLGAAGGLHEDFVPAPGGFIQQRAGRVLGEAVELLERIVDDGLLTAIADGTFGITKRPADRGRGLDGVAAHADDYYNPATELLESVEEGS